jgi:hypothetical protein
MQFCCATKDGMPADAPSEKDDRLTVIAISALACILQTVLHEGLGHGVTAWLSGARSVTMSTVALQCDIDTKWISANGTLVNLIFAAIFWRLLLRPQRYGRLPTTSSCWRWLAISLPRPDTFSFPASPTSATGQL